MKRLFLTGLLLGVVAGAVPASADGVTVNGFVRTSAVTPTLPRTLHLVTEQANGTIGWVAELPASSATRAYEAHVESAAPGATDLDVWFYRDLEGTTGTGDPCPRDTLERYDGGETGTACAGARYAVVVLFAGADVEFRLTVG